MTWKLFSISVTYLMAFFVTMPTAYAQDIAHIPEKITGPWLWMIAPTERLQGGAKSINVDSLAVASNGAVTEADIATNGANEGDRVGNFVWTLGHISPIGGNNINDCLNRIGLAAGDVNDHSAYALFSLTSDADRNRVTMVIGSDDAIKVWLNGEVVHNNPMDRRAVDFLDAFLVDLRSGENLLMVKVSERAGNWSMFVGIDDGRDRDPDVVRPALFSGERPVVRLIYFLPNDRESQPDIDAKMDKLIKDVQQFYAYLMEAHGFGRKTFKFETDEHGNAVVHHVQGKFNDAHYQDHGAAPFNEISGAFDKSKNIYLIVTDTTGEYIDFGTLGEVCGLGSNHGKFGGVGLIPASGHCFRAKTTAHELGHAFGLGHDYYRAKGKWISYPGVSDRMVTSFCAAEWLDVHPAFNPSNFTVPPNEPTTVKMLSSSFVPSNSIRLRFEVTNPIGLHQARLMDQYGRLISCKSLNGSTKSTVEFVTTELPLESEGVSLRTIDVHGNVSWDGIFPIDVRALFPPPKVISIQDTNLATAVREALNLGPNDTLTTHTMLNLTSLQAYNRGITTLIGLEHAYYLKSLGLVGNSISDVSPLVGLTNLTGLQLSDNNISDISRLASLTNLTGLWLMDNNISGVSPLANLTNLTQLDLTRNNISDVSSLTSLTNLTYLLLTWNNISDVSPLANLKNLTELWLMGNNISDVSPLANLKNLTELWLNDNDISDVSLLMTLYPEATSVGLRLDLHGNPLSDTSINTHIPALQAKGISVWFDNRASAEDFTDTLEKITGPWLWMITPTDRYQGGARSIDVDSLAAASKGTVTEAGVATNGVNEGDRIGNLVWTYGHISPTDDNNINECLNKIGLAAGDVDDHSAYALFLLTSDIERTGVQMRVGSDDAIKVWLNGEVVHKYAVNRPASDFQDTFQVDLEKGDNLLLVKVSERAGNWTMFVGIEPIESNDGAQNSNIIADVNGDGVVNIQDLVVVASHLGQDGQNGADVNGDGAVNIQDLVLVAGELGTEAAAPSAWHRTSGSVPPRATVEQWLTQAYRVSLIDPRSQRGVLLLERLLAALTPKETTLLANYPNPFNPETWIPYQLAESAEIILSIYAVDGRVVRQLTLGHQPAGMYRNKKRAAYWDGRNEQGERVASGVYFYMLTAGDFSATQKMLIRK